MLASGMLLWFVLTRIAVADLLPPQAEAPPCHATRCSGAESRECITTLGQVADCDWITAGWERACLRKTGTKAVHVFCRTDDAEPAEAPPAPPVEVAATPASGCGCRTAAGPSIGWVLLLIAGGLGRTASRRLR